MGKQPAIMLYIGEWKKDAALAMCCPLTRGVWLELLLAMHDQDRCGELSGTLEQLARLGRCSDQEMESTLDELERTKSAPVTHRNKIITVTSRKMLREYNARKSNSSRQKRHRNAKTNVDVETDVTKKSHSPPHTPPLTSISISPPNPPDSNFEKDFQADQNEWGGVGDLLKAEGVGQWQAAIGALERFGATTEIALAIIEHYQSHRPAWDAGALYNRCVLWRPDQTIDEQWPRVPTGTTTQAERDEKATQYAAQQARNDADLERAALEFRQRKELEAQFGEVLDAMDPEQRETLFQAAVPEPELRNATRPHKSMKREVMLQKLAKQTKERN